MDALNMKLQQSEEGKTSKHLKRRKRCVLSYSIDL